MYWQAMGNQDTGKLWLKPINPRSSSSSPFAFVGRALFSVRKTYKLTSVLEPFRVRFEIGGPVAWFFSITGFITLKTQAAGSPIGTFGDDGKGAIGI